MGICKCRRRAELFCFDHRKAVCPTCIADHPVCTIRTYHQWLKDTTYAAPCCSACAKLFSDSPDLPVVRLCCFHPVHAACLRLHLATFPPHTALAGFTCPAHACQQPVLSHPDASAAASSDASGQFLRAAILALLQEDAQTPLVLLNAVQEELGLLRPALNGHDSTDKPQDFSSSLNSTTATLSSTSTPSNASSSSNASAESSEVVGFYSTAQVASRKPASSASSASALDQDAKRKPLRPVGSQTDYTDDDKYRRKPVQQLCQFLGIVDSAQHGGNAKARPLSNINKLFLIFAGLCAIMTIFMLYFFLSTSPLEIDPIDQ